MLSRLMLLLLSVSAVLLAGCDASIRTSGEPESCNAILIDSSDEVNSLLPQSQAEQPRMSVMLMPTVQVLFKAPEGMRIDHDTDVGKSGYRPLIAPARCNFAHGSAVRLKLTKIEDRDDAEVQATLEIYPVTTGTSIYIEHNSVPIGFTAEDLDQALTGSVVTKAYYLVPQTKSMPTIPPIEVVVGTSNDPGDDASTKAGKLGTLLAVVRLAGKVAMIPSSTYPMNSDDKLMLERMATPLKPEEETWSSGKAVPRLHQHRSEMTSA